MKWGVDSYVVVMWRNVWQKIEFLGIGNTGLK